MAEKSKISWTDSTLNFWEGCAKVSPGCANCYAETRDKHHHGVAHWGPGAPRRKSKSAVKDALAFNRKPWICDECGEASAEIPKAPAHNYCFGDCAGCGQRTRHHRRRIFSLSLGDWLEGPPISTMKDGTPIGGISVEWRAEMLHTIHRCPDVEWILCTKRPESFFDRMAELASCVESIGLIWVDRWVDGNAPRNITLLASVENQEQADIRIPALLCIPAARCGLSLEPLLGPVVIAPEIWRQLEWAIIGGESGPKARPCNVEWIRSLVRQGQSAGAATFVKQLGAKPFCRESRYQGIAHMSMEEQRTVEVLELVTNPKGADPSEWPEDLRVQQFPFVS
jgi:protein gp37